MTLWASNSPSALSSLFPRASLKTFFSILILKKSFLSHYVILVSYSPVESIVYFGRIKFRLPLLYLGRDLSSIHFYIRGLLWHNSSELFVFFLPISFNWSAWEKHIKIFTIYDVRILETEHRALKIRDCQWSGKILPWRTDRIGLLYV